jgi:hypothetical protein
MKTLIIFLFITASSILFLQIESIAFASDKPTQHLRLPDVTSLEEAKKVFLETTSVLQSKRELGAKELIEIHLTTYSLEKAIAYFVENMKSDQQIKAKEMAEVVELIHLASETDRAEETRVYLEEYSKRAFAFTERL